jgi:hypothetical protein
MIQDPSKKGVLRTQMALDQNAKARAIHIINTTIGEHAVFAGTITLGDSPEDKPLTDDDLLSSIEEQYDTGKPAAY